MFRYLKNVFPKVDETLLLDVLEQSDNNVHKASEKLIERGYEKRNPTGPSKSAARVKEEALVNMRKFINFSYGLINTSHSLNFYLK